MLNKRIGSIVLVLSLSSSLLVGCNSNDLSSTQDEPTKQEQQIITFNSLTMKTESILKDNFSTCDVAVEGYEDKMEVSVAIINPDLQLDGLTYEQKQQLSEQMGLKKATDTLVTKIIALYDKAGYDIDIIFTISDDNWNVIYEYRGNGTDLNKENNQQKPADEQEQPTKEQNNQQQNNNQTKPARKSIKDSFIDGMKDSNKQEVPVNNSNSDNALEGDRNNDGKLDHFDDYDDCPDIVDDDIPTHADNWDGGKVNTDENGNDLMESEPVKDSIYDHVDENGLLP